MTYAIGHFVYGINISKLFYTNEPLYNDLIDALDDGEDRYFLQYYSGSGDVTPAALGVDLGIRIDECHDVSWSELTQKVDRAFTQAVRDEYAQILADALVNPEFIQEFKDYLTKTEPGIFILWGSS